MKNELLISKFDEWFVFFFMVNTTSSVSSFQQLIEGQGEDSRGKRSLAWKSTAVS
ncbi:MULTISPECIES: hypothetical protein [Priestia]|uniref:hypothetical protein n=1 Tax=Priestia TaxID=2800373 RepID=UPI001CD4DDF0|nr:MULTISPECIES: hypothetical protein [Priestia]MCA1052980.1 hypothetical protein [Priestia aryabhattai]MEB4858595.1 hypothetical protein [Priestia megaterium]